MNWEKGEDMSNFIRDAACHGHQPQGVIPLRHNPRPHLVNQLLSERHSPRFLVAPGGFGKKTLMAEYAEVVFSFEHVFWICGTSPCFLRDLDAEIIAVDVRRWDEDCRLVVFQDVPCMDEQRSELFGNLVGELVQLGYEVMCSLAPSADVYGSVLNDRVLLDGFALLATAEERVPRLPDEDGVVADRLPPSACIPCLLWGEKGSLQLLEGLRRETLPGEVFAVASAALLMGCGQLDDLGCFLGSGHLTEVLELLARSYPYAGVALEDGRFEASRVGVGEFCQVIGTVLNANCSGLPCEGRDGLAIQAANIMLSHGDEGRAFETVSSLASRTAAMRWLSDNSWSLVKGGFAKEYCLAFLKASRRHVPVPPTASSAAAWGFAEMGDIGEATRLARSVVMAAGSDDGSRSMAAILLAMVGEGETLARADEAMGRVMRKSKSLQSRGEAVSVADEVLDAVAVQAALQEGPGLAVQVFRDQLRRKLGAAGRPWPASLVLSAVLVLNWLLNVCPGEDSLGVDEAEEVEDFIQECILALDALCGSGESLEWGHVRMGTLLEEIVGARRFGVSLKFRPATMAALKKAQGQLADDQGDYRRSCRQLEAERNSREMTRKDAFRPAPGRSKAEGAGNVFPILRVNMFGSFVVYMGDRRLDERLLARRKSRTLLALLVLNHGREVSVDYLSATFWPDTVPSAARKNFYSLWSLLRRVLSVDGQCPYLIRTEMSVRVNYDLVESDIESFEDLCRQLLFGSSAGTNWEELLALASGRFGGVLLPAERDNAVIQESRHRLHTNITDALVAASGRLLTAGEPQGALWFAREALRRDQSREDVYLAQMKAQVASEQRAAALDTFFACRAYLSEQLGIDPSPRLVELYRSIIEEEVDL